MAELTANSMNTAKKRNRDKRANSVNLGETRGLAKRFLGNAVAAMISKPLYEHRSARQWDAHSDSHTFVAEAAIKTTNREAHITEVV